MKKGCDIGCCQSNLILSFNCFYLEGGRRHKNIRVLLNTGWGCLISLSNWHRSILSLVLSGK